MQERLGLVAGREYVGRVVLRGRRSRGPVAVSLAWGGGASDRQTVVIESPGAGFTKHPLRFRAGGTTDNGRLEIVARGSGALVVGAVSLMPADNVLGWRRDTLARLRELDSPVYRWPGGNFVSGYDWQDGIGDRDRRPPRKNPAWKGIESNDVGPARVHGADARDRRRALRGGEHRPGRRARRPPSSCSTPTAPSTTPLGRRRADNGSPAPFAVKLWAIGNEMYGEWQIGHMPLAKYVEKHREVVDAMRAEDPEDPAGRGGRARRVEQDDAPGRERPHELHQRAPLLAEQARRAGARGAGARRHPQGRRGPPRLPARDRRRSRARTSGSRSTSGTTGTGPTSTASSARATSSRTASGSRPASTSSSATATCS